MSTLRVAVSTPEELGAAWERLWQRVAGASPFQSPAWLRAWAARYALGRCRIATVENDAELVGCLPLFWWQGELLLAGTGPSDHGDALLLPGHEDRVAELLAAVLTVATNPIERIVLRQLPLGSPLLSMTCPRGWRDRVEPDDLCPQLQLGGPDGMAHVGAGQRTNWRNAMRRVARHGAEVERVADAEVVDAVAALERLHARRWEERGESGVLADPLLRDLLRSAAAPLARAGILRLSRIRRGTETIAVLLALRAHRCTAFFLSGFDPAFAALSPVTALIGAAIGTAAHEGDRAVDFLRGREPYKYGWGAVDVPTAVRVFVPA